MSSGFLPQPISVERLRGETGMFTGMIQASNGVGLGEGEESGGPWRSKEGVTEGRRGS